ncbi:uncharacterized protein J8A68_001366 [[Candida] subhashii]|uniref:Endonuclease/exonuclease/phosphatase domain-containing protein n=1 Tax=[Candida] subhashii TaxID=561895 RepID=A0A8J5US04_9ASCO|nr:uncharacterized protein J8A68_001366 [[Candida] subhashii]KAG7665057.1 hypothetical protein J8A68_001366 [[Candida] subhashii]
MSRSHTNKNTRILILSLVLISVLILLLNKSRNSADLDFLPDLKSSWNSRNDDNSGAPQRKSPIKEKGKTNDKSTAKQKVKAEEEEGSAKKKKEPVPKEDSMGKMKQDKKTKQEAAYDDEVYEADEIAKAKSNDNKGYPKKKPTVGQKQPTDKDSEVDEPEEQSYPNELDHDDEFSLFDIDTVDEVSEPFDPKNPNKFLGNTKEMTPSEKDATNNILDYDQNQDNKLLGVPTTKQLHLKPVLVDEPPYPNIPVNFGKIPIEPLRFRIYSHNIKNGGNHILVPGEQEWKARVRPIASSIRFHAQENTIITLQEVYKYQMLDLLKELNEMQENEWEYYGVGRIDGNELGEFVPIIYRPKEWELVYSDTMWLNERNPRMSVEGWDATYLRIVSYVTLRHRESNNYINIFNTHFDHIGTNSQIGSANLIFQRITEINDWPSFVVGDLNSEPKHDAYKFFKQHMTDASRLTTPFNKYGHSKSSYTGFEGEVLMEGGKTIDYIFAPKYSLKIDEKSTCDSLNPNSAANKIDLRLEKWAMLHSKFDGAYISDHRPLVADFKMTKKC